VLGGVNRAVVGEDALATLRSIQVGFHQVPVALRGNTYGTVTTAWGEEVEIVAGKGADLFTWSDMAVTSTIELEPVTTARENTKVGEVTFTAGDERVTVPLVLDREVEGPDAWWRITHPGDLF
jgi:D-alanyl-D-alanine carboxypeptidase (penicillin-binding protein 5/6)